MKIEIEASDILNPLTDIVKETAVKIDESAAAECATKVVEFFNGSVLTAERKENLILFCLQLSDPSVLSFFKTINVANRDLSQEIYRTCPDYQARIVKVTREAAKWHKITV